MSSSESNIDSGDLWAWRDNEISQYIIKEVQSKLNECKKELVDGALIVSPALEREYCRAIGEIMAHEWFLKLIEGDEK